jgi:mevalonate kinase
MHSARQTAAVLLAILFGVSSTFAQQTHIVDSTTIQQALGERMNEQDADRETLRRLLQREEVRQIVEKNGLSLERAEAAVSTLDGEELRQLAQQAQQVEESLAGGRNITIVLSTTTLLLIIILILLLR